MELIPLTQIWGIELRSFRCENMYVSEEKTWRLLGVQAECPI